MRHILAITAGLIAGVAGASVGGSVIGFAGLVSVFLSIEVVSPQNGAHRVWGHSDIMIRIAQNISDAASIELERVRPVRMGALRRSLHNTWRIDDTITHAPLPIAYTGDTIRLD